VREGRRHLFTSTRSVEDTAFDPGVVFLTKERIEEIGVILLELSLVHDTVGIGPCVKGSDKASLIPDVYHEVGQTIIVPDTAAPTIRVSGSASGLEVGILDLEVVHIYAGCTGDHIAGSVNSSADETARDDQY
jgi:hypothetical protein